MKTEDIKKIYNSSPELHNAIKHTLDQLDDSAPIRYRKQKAIRRMVVAIASIAVLAAFTTVAYATNLFGLLIEPFGKYGVDIQVEQETTDSVTTPIKHAKPNPTYLPEGCCQLLGNNEDDTNILNPEGATAYNPNGIYTYTNSKDTFAEPDETWVHIFVHEAGDFHEEARYIVGRFEKEYNGHKVVFLTRQFEENGEKEYYAFKYFEDWGYVAECYYNDMPELKKIMEGLELQEAGDYTEPMTINYDDDPTADYAFSLEEETREYKIDEAFTWSMQTVHATTYDYQDGKYEITVRSVKESDGVKGLDKSNLLVPDDEEWYARYFNSDGSLKTPYIRTDRNIGGGVYALDHSESKTVNRRFWLVTVKVKAIEESSDGFNGQFMTNVGGVLYQENHNENGADIYTIGVVADEDEWNESALCISSSETVIDDKTQTVVRKDVDTVVPLLLDQ